MEIMGEEAIADYPFREGAKRVCDDQSTLMLNRTWQPTLTVTGQGGFPDIEDAGYVMLPCLEYRFSLRMPPSLNSDKAVEDLTELLTNDPPYGAEVINKFNLGLTEECAIGFWLEHERLR